MSPDPHSGTLLHVLSPQRWNMYAYALNNPLAYVDPDGRDAMAVVFPKYRIGMSGSGLPGLGHAGIVVIDRDGHTTYREYGRYGANDAGIVRPLTESGAAIETPNVEIGADGLPTKASLESLMGAISTIAGHSGPVEGAYFRTTPLEDQAMLSYFQFREGLNSQPDRCSYDTLSNSCGTFAVNTLVVGGRIDARTAASAPARPIGLINWLLGFANYSVHYEQAKTKDKKKKEKIDIHCVGIEGCEGAQDD